MRGVIFISPYELNIFEIHNTKKFFNKIKKNSRNRITN